MPLLARPLAVPTRMRAIGRIGDTEFEIEVPDHIAESIRAGHSFRLVPEPAELCQRRPTQKSIDYIEVPSTFWEDQLPWEELSVGDNGDEPDPQEGEYWYCRHCGASGRSETAPTNCPNCGKPN